MAGLPSSIRQPPSAGRIREPNADVGGGRPITQEIDIASNAVLIVEDDADLREALSSLLLDHGFLVMAVSNGREALDVMLSCRPGVVVLDLMMPGMSGRELLQIIDRERALSTIPVLLMTASCDHHGLAGRPLFHKPLDFESLLRAVEACVGRRATAPG